MDIVDHIALMKPSTYAEALGQALLAKGLISARINASPTLALGNNLRVG